MVGVTVVGERGEVLNAGRTGAALRVSEAKVAVTPSIKRSTRDLTKLDPRSDGNLSFAGENWLYNNISVDGSYFNNSFGLDDPAPGGQANAEPIPYDAVAELQVSLAPFDVREGGFTGANINTVTKSGTNDFKATAYTFARNDAFQGNTVSGTKVVANPHLSYNQSGASISGALVKDKLFYYVNGEIERTKDPGSNFVARTGGASGLGISRAEASVLDAIRQRLITGYNYDPGPYEGYFFNTDNDKLIAKLDWNIAGNQNLSFRFNYLDAKRDQGPHPFVLSPGNTGRGPNESTLPFYKSGYAINNDLQSYALEHNSRGTRIANRFFASYNRFRDARTPFSEDFPTIDIAEGGVTYTTAGHEPFSINNILDQDVFQLTNNLSYFRGNHAFTVGANFESFDFFNSFNIFRHGVFFLPAFIPIGSTFGSLAEFFAATAPGPNKKNFAGMIGSGPFKGENIHVGQLSFYGQDELLATDRLKLTLGMRVDLPPYFTDPVDNPFSRGLKALDEERANGSGGPEQASRHEADLFAALRLQLERSRRPTHADPRRYRHLRRPGAVRVDWGRHFQPWRQPQPRAAQRTNSNEEGCSACAIVRRQRIGPRFRLATVMDHRLRHRSATSMGDAGHGGNPLLEGSQGRVRPERRPQSAPPYASGWPPVLRRFRQQ